MRDRLWQEQWFSPQDIDESSLIGIRDSKELTASVRERMDLRIHEVALAVGIGRGLSAGG